MLHNPSFYVGGTFSYNPAASPLFSSTNFFNLQGTVYTSAFGIDSYPWGESECSSGSLVAQTSAPGILDNYGVFTFDVNRFVYMSNNGNPLVAIGVVPETQSTTYMENLSTKVYSGLYTGFVSGSSQTNYNVLIYPDVNGTTYTIQSINPSNINNPTQGLSLVGTLACTNINTPSAGFCSGTYQLGNSGPTGEAICEIATTPSDIMACIAQNPATPSESISIIGTVSAAANLGVTLSYANGYNAAVVASPNGTNIASITATLTNLSGRPITEMGYAPTSSNCALQSNLSRQIKMAISAHHLPTQAYLPALVEPAAARLPAIALAP